MRADNDLLLNRNNNNNNNFTELPKSYHNAVEIGQTSGSKRGNAINL